MRVILKTNLVAISHHVNVWSLLQRRAPQNQRRAPQNQRRAPQNPRRAPQNQRRALLWSPVFKASFLTMVLLTINIIARSNTVAVMERYKNFMSHTYWLKYTATEYITRPATLSYIWEMINTKLEV